MASTPLITLEQAGVSYGSEAVLRDVSLAFHPGEIVALVGPNGAGKTTLLRAISGAARLDAGALLLGGMPLGRIRPEQRARRIGVVPQQFSMPEGFRVAEIVLMGRAPHVGLFGAETPRDYAAVEHAMRITDTLALATRMATRLSGGEQQRVLLARALAQQPDVLLLDEATAHLDLRHQVRVLEIVHELAASGVLVIVALHDLNLAAQYARRLIFLHHGRVVADGTPLDVLTVERIRDVYDVEAVIGTHPERGTPSVSVLGARRD